MLYCKCNANIISIKNLISNSFHEGGCVDIYCFQAKTEEQYIRCKLLLKEKNLKDRIKTL